MHEPLRPAISVLGDSLVGAIIDEAMTILERVGVYVENSSAVAILLDGGARLDPAAGRVLLPRAIVEACLKTTPSSILLSDARCAREHTVGGDSVHFDPGSAALRVFDHSRQIERPATTDDVVEFCRIVEKLEGFHFQSTGIISGDVPERMADAYRLFIGLMFCTKPVVTGTFVVEGFAPMMEMLAAVRGGTEALRARPLAIFDACPSPPLRWSHLTSQSVIDCARAGIPSEFVAMPLTGATAPATLTGALVQHTAENLSGVALAQLSRAGAPVIFGGSPACFDLRAGTPPMGAIETMMMDIGYTQVGKRLGLPTHAYMGLTDSKTIDAQAGLESGIGAVLAALGGINVVSGGGMMDYESAQSLEKLVVDNEICLMAYRLLDGIRQREDPMALHLFEGMAEGLEFMTHPHTLAWYRREQFIPSIVHRGNYQEWVNDGKPAMADRAGRTARKLLAGAAAPVAAPDLADELTRIMSRHAKACGMERLPPLTRPAGTVTG